MSKPVIVSVTDFIKNFSTYQQHTSQGISVCVTRHANIVGVFISDDQFQEYERGRVEEPPKVLVLS